MPITNGILSRALVIEAREGLILYADGLVQQVWLRGDAGGACMIVEAASTDEVAEKLDTLALVREGYLQPRTIVPLKPYWVL